MKVWITKEEGSSIQVAGLDRVHIWLFEPCINVRLLGFLDSWNYKRTKKQEKLASSIREGLKGIYLTDEGHKLFRPYKNDSPIPKKLIELYEDHLASFNWEVFGCGSKVNHRPMAASHIFGFADRGDSTDKIAEKVWELVSKSFYDAPFDDWGKCECVEWYDWCESIDIEISLKI